MDERPVFQDDGSHVYTFCDRCLVECPKCGGQAEVTPHRELVHRFVCTQCGQSQERTTSGAGLCTDPRDPWFHYPLWLQTPCCGENLWAFNPEHLSFIENYVRAELRRGMPLENNTALIRNATLASRLPRWMILSHHRDDVLRGVAKLQNRLLQAK